MDIALEPSAETSLHEVLWDGVRLDNGDGFTLAKYDNHGFFFDAKLESISLLQLEEGDMHALKLKLNFMKPFIERHRIRAAKVEATVSPVSESPRGSPHIRAIRPQADRVEVSQMEVTTGQKVTAGATGTGGASSFNISLEGSKGKKTTFAGVRVIHGVIKDRTRACWSMYEESGSKSGLPEILRLLLVVHCEEEFDIRLSMSVRAARSFTFGLPLTLRPKMSQLSYRVPDLKALSEAKVNGHLRQLRDMAYRAAAVVAEAKNLDKAQSEIAPRERDLLIEAGQAEDYLRGWADTFKATRFGVLPMRLRPAIERESVESLPSRWHSRAHTRTASAGMTRDRDSSPISEPLPGPPRGTESESEQSVIPVIINHRSRRSSSADSLTRHRVIERRRRRRSPSPPPLWGGEQTTNALDSFSAVGPGYSVSRLA